MQKGFSHDGTSVDLQLIRKRQRKMYWKNNAALYYMMIPGIILVFIFRLVPLYGLLIAFKNYDMYKGFMASPWTGLTWFRVLFESPDFLRILRNTLMISLYEILVVFIGSIVFALLINEIRSSAYKRIVQTVSYLPHFLSWVIVGGLVIQLLSSDNFLVQTVARLIGKEPTNLLMHENYFYGIVTVGELWKSIGWNTILYLAAMAGINTELYEAARIDGAGKLRQIFHVTLPGIEFIIVLTLLMKIGAIMNVGFEKIFVLQNDMILNKAEVFSTYNYKIGIGKWNMSLSAALSVFESFTNFALVFIFDRISKALGEEGIF